MTRHSYFWLIALTLYALYLRAWGLSEWALSGDDGQHLIYMLRPEHWWQVFSYVSAKDNHPPLWYFAWRGMAAISTDNFSVRLPNLVMGTALVPLSFFWGRAIAGTSCAFAMAVIAAILPLYVDLSEILRGYVPAITLFTASVLMFLRWRHTRKLKHLACYSMLALAAMWTEYNAIILVGALGIAALIQIRHERPARAQWVLANAAIVPLAAIPLAIYMSIQPYGVGPDVNHVSAFFANSVSELFKLMYGVYRFVPPARTAFAHHIAPYMLVLSLIGTGLMLRRRETRMWGWFTVMVLILSALFCVLGVYPLAQGRHALHIAPAYALGLSGLVAEMARQRRRWSVAGNCLVGALFVMMASGVHLLDPQWHRKKGFELRILQQEWQQALDVLHEKGRKGDVILGSEMVMFPLKYELLRGNFPPHIKQLRCWWTWIHIRYYQLEQCIESNMWQVKHSTPQVWHLMHIAGGSVGEAQQPWVKRLYGTAERPKQTGYMGSTVSIFTLPEAEWKPALHQKSRMTW